MSSPSSPAVPRRLPPSSAVFRRFPLFSAVACRPPPSPAVLHHPLPSPITPYKNMSQIVGLVVLPNDGRPGNSRTRTDGILSSRPVIFSSCPTSRNERRVRTTFCRPVSSRALGSPPAGPYRGPGRLRTLAVTKHFHDGTLKFLSDLLVSFPNHRIEASWRAARKNRCTNRVSTSPTNGDRRIDQLITPPNCRRSLETTHSRRRHTRR